MSKENPQTASPSERLEELLSGNTNTEQHNSESAGSGIFDDAREDSPKAEEGDLLFSSDYKMQHSDDPLLVPKLFTSLPALRDPLKTDSSSVQDSTVQECLPFLAGSGDPEKSASDVNVYGVPNLDRKAHIAFLHSSLGELPPGFVAADASRPWMLYWALVGLYLLGEDISAYRERCVFSTQGEPS
jgi:protein farnesyltransferase subunit beta